MDCGLQIRADLVFARNYVQPFVSVQRGGGAVADAVYIDNLSGFAYRVRAADICFGDGAPRRAEASSSAFQCQTTSGQTGVSFL